MASTPQTFDSVLVANRGEIARRVFASCRRLGLSTVAVFADDDADEPHVQDADSAVRLPGSSLAETYLNADLLIQAAHRAGATAVHPGYGLLSENADFARAVLAAGLAWIGPPPEAIASMGSKIEAKRLMAASGVPVLAERHPDDLRKVATENDFPLIIKASAGGGGRGMRIVHSLAQLDAELPSARAEARAAFGDDTVFCEPYRSASRHIEVQVLADRHGTVWALGERECSIQRRHQKIVEESPSPLVQATPGLRDRLFDAAVTATKAIDYVGAGTVEFLAEESGEFYFLEMNTRIQVEHPVTECTTGLDLVGLQLQIAAGALLAGSPPAASGHAIEVRLCAEDPARNWRPQSGTLHRIAVPGVSAEFGPLAQPGLRLDCGVRAGSVIGVRYDPMLAKLICWTPQRAEAAGQLATALARAEIHGIGTNRELLVSILRHPDFLAGATDTGFLDRHWPQLSRPLADKPAQALSALVAAVSDAAANRAGTAVLPQVPIGWRNVASQAQRKSFLTTDGDRHDIEYRLDRDGLHADGFAELRLVSASPTKVIIEGGGVRRGFRIARYGALVCIDSALGPVTLEQLPRFADPALRPLAGSLLAPMPGAVVRIAVVVGEQVVAGQPLLWLEAMKMQHPIVAPATGTVTRLPVAEGQQVELGSVLVVLGGSESSGEPV